MRCPFCNEEMVQVYVEADGRSWRCNLCQMTTPSSITHEQAAITFRRMIQYIRDWRHERLYSARNIDKARREINDLREKKKPTSADVNRMATLASYDNSYVNLAQAI